MKCPYCNSELRRELSFCHKCGNVVFLNQTEELSAPNNQTMQIKKTPIRKNINPTVRTVLIVVATVLILIDAVIIIPALLSNRSHAADNTKDEGQSKEKQSKETIIYATDDVVNRFISEFNTNSFYEITNISKGNIRTKFFGYANGRYLEMINANSANAKAFCLTINGGQEDTDKQSMYEVFKEAVKILDPSITEGMINTTLTEFDTKNVLIEKYMIGDNICVTYVPTKELSYGKNSCRIDIYAFNYK